MVRAKIIKGAKDAKMKTRKYVQIPDLYYDDFEFGDVVEITKVKDKEKVNGATNPTQSKTPVSLETV